MENLIKDYYRETVNFGTTENPINVYFNNRGRVTQVNEEKCMTVTISGGMEENTHYSMDKNVLDKNGLSIVAYDKFTSNMGIPIGEILDGSCTIARAGLHSEPTKYMVFIKA